MYAPFLAKPVFHNDWKEVGLLKRIHFIWGSQSTWQVPYILWTGECKVHWAVPCMSPGSPAIQKRPGRIYCFPEYSRLSSVICHMAVVTAQQWEPPSHLAWWKDGGGANSWPTWSNDIGPDCGFTSFFFWPYFFSFFFLLPIFNWRHLICIDLNTLSLFKQDGQCVQN